MDLLNKTKELCRIYGITPARSKGQNFLIKEDFYDKIIAAADLKVDEVILEVGPGLGFLTAKLASKVEKVIAVELDDKLARFLRTALKKQGVKNVEILNENVLDFSIMKHVSCIKKNENNACIHNTLYNIHNTKFKIVANLPYNITSIFLRKFLSGENKPEMMVLMLQKEVAERITAKPGKMSILAVSVQFYAQAEIISLVLKNAFWPEPEVDSAIVKLTSLIKGGPRGIINDRQVSPVSVPGITVDKERDFFRMVKFGFSARRKMLKNNLAGGYHVEQKTADIWLELAKIDLKVRAQDLSMNDWYRLFDVIRQKML